MTLDDLDFLAELLGHPEVMRHYPSRLTREGAEGWLRRQLERYERDGHGHWLVTDRATGAPVGQVGLLMQTVEGARVPEVGWLIHFPYWRRGYASEAAAGVRDWAFVVQAVPRVVSLIRPENLSSQGVARKIGMRQGPRVEFAGMPHDVWEIE